MEGLQVIHEGSQRIDESTAGISSDGILCDADEVLPRVCTMVMVVEKHEGVDA